MDCKSFADAVPEHKGDVDDEGEVRPLGACDLQGDGHLEALLDQHMRHGRLEHGVDGGFGIRCCHGWVDVLVMVMVICCWKTGELQSHQEHCLCGVPSETYISHSAVETISEEEAIPFLDAVDGSAELRVLCIAVDGEGIGALRWLRCCCVAREAHDNISGQFH